MLYSSSIQNIYYNLPFYSKGTYDALYAIYTLSIQLVLCLCNPHSSNFPHWLYFSISISYNFYGFVWRIPVFWTLIITNKLCSCEIKVSFNLLCFLLWYNSIKFCKLMVLLYTQNTVQYTRLTFYNIMTHYKGWTASINSNLLNQLQSIFCDINTIRSLIEFEIRSSI